MTAASEPLEPDISGQVLDRYQLTQRLGIGGMGAVYEAIHTKLEKRVAIKLLRHEFSRQEIARKRFLREAKAATRVKHPNVVDISDFGETEDGRVYFVMELLPGADLGDLLKAQGRLSWPRTRALLLQVASALEAAHAQGIVHRDMKPSNCFLVEVPGMEGDFMKVLDFGIAKFSSGADEETEGLTSTNEVFGTVAYMAPEMAQGTTNDIRSDIYAVGVMMYRMLTGELPFNEGNAFQILSQHIGMAPPPPREKEPSIPIGVEEIMLKALQKQPEFRFQSMAEFAAALRAESADVPAVSGINPIVDATMVLSFPTGSVSQPVPQGTAVLAMDSELSATAAQPTGGTQVHTTDGPQHVTAGTTGASPAATTSHTMQATTMGLHGSTAMQMVPVVQQRKILPIVLLTILGVALIGGALGAGLLLGGGSEAEPTTVAALPPAAVAAPAATKAAVNSPPEPNTKADPPPTVEAEPVPTEEPAVAAGSAGAAPPPADADADRTKAEPDTVSPSTPQVRRRTGAKPKSDAAVIANLKRRMAGKCTQDGNVQVRLEGLISSQGRIQGALATPRSGPGGCAEKILKSARFASRPDMKPMPIFTIKL